MRLLVLSDTHVRRGGSRQLPREVLDAAEQADLIVHAGDIVTAEVLHTLAELAPVHAVLGNNDHELVGRLPHSLALDVAGVSLAVIHDSGPTEGRPNRLRRMFPAADLVIFGHSHTPCNDAGRDGQWLLNPGSSTERRRAPTHTYAWVDVDQDGHFASTLVHLER